MVGIKLWKYVNVEPTKFSLHIYIIQGEYGDKRLSQV